MPVAAGEPVAIVAMSGRWPGGAHSPEELWEILGSGSDVISEFPANRGWDLAGAANRVGHRLRRLPARRRRVRRRLLRTQPARGHRHRSAAADPAGVGLGAVRTGRPRPLGAARQPDRRVRGRHPHDYGPRLHEIPDDHQGHALTGTLTSAASGRIAYTLGLEGPAITVDTACSSSLVAIHLAVEALRRGECDLAVAGGAAVMSNPGMFTEFSRQGGLASDGRIKPFAAAADGTAWAEGAGLVLLEPLSAARRNGHPVLAVVRGSAVNQDGASNGFTAPSGTAQQRVIRAALAVAGLAPGEVDAVEAHGTGTTLGDPIEAGAILATYGRDRERPLLLGSSKAHLGHTQAAAGVTGLVSMVQAIRSGTLPPTLHIDEPSARRLDLRPGRPAHRAHPVAGDRTAPPRRRLVVRHQRHQRPPDRGTGPGRPPGTRHDLKGGRAARSLGQVGGGAAGAGGAAAEAAGRPSGDHRGRRRAHLDHRPGPVHPPRGRDRRPSPRPRRPRRRDRPPRRGERYRHEAGRAGVPAHRAGQPARRMGRELAEGVPLRHLADALAEVADHLDTHLDHPIRDVMFTRAATACSTPPPTPSPPCSPSRSPCTPSPSRPGCAPPTSSAISIGELAAAHPRRGALAARRRRPGHGRGRLMQSVAETGAMAALRATEADLAGLLGDKVDIAAVNGPDSLVVSGDRDAVEPWVARWRDERRQAKELQVSHAFHSPHMDAVVDEFRQIAAGVSYHPPSIPLISNVTGRLATTEQLTDPGYWAGHIRRAVRFHDGVTTLRDLGVTDFVEIGPAKRSPHW